ncbi:MAG: hypothetical protein ACT4QD_00860, partial [Acidobacteriota bacterium]
MATSNPGRIVRRVTGPIPAVLTGLCLVWSATTGAVSSCGTPDTAPRRPWTCGGSRVDGRVTSEAAAAPYLAECRRQELASLPLREAHRRMCDA